MKRTYKASELPNPVEILRKAGYSYFRDPQSGEESFVLRLTSEFYPRFHLYLEDTVSDVTFSLHLDQKQPSYGDHNMHSGEYDGPTVEKEMQRIDGWVRAMSQRAQEDNAEHDIDEQSHARQRQYGDLLLRWWRKLMNMLGKKWPDRPRER